MTYATALYNSPRQRSLRRRTAQQCELARLELVRMRAAQDTINRMLSPVAEQATIHLSAIQYWQVEPTRDTEGMVPVARVRTV